MSDSEVELPITSEEESPRGNIKKISIAIAATIVIIVIICLYEYWKGDRIVPSSSNTAPGQPQPGPLNVNNADVVVDVLETNVAEPQQTLSPLRKVMVWGSLLAVAVACVLAVAAVWYLSQTPTDLLVEDSILDPTTHTIDQVVETDGSALLSEDLIQWFLSCSLLAQVALIVLLTCVIRILLVLGCLATAVLFGISDFELNAPKISLGDGGLSISAEVGFRDATWQQFLHVETLQSTKLLVYMPKILPTASILSVDLPPLKFAKGSSIMNLNKSPLNVKLAENIPLQEFYSNLKNETKLFSGLKGYSFPIGVYFEGDIYTTMLPVPIRLNGARTLIQKDIEISPSTSPPPPPTTTPTTKPKMELIDKFTLTSDKLTLTALLQIDLSKLPKSTTVNVSSDRPMIDLAVSNQLKGVKKQILGAKVLISNGDENHKMKVSTSITIDNGNNLDSILSLIQQLNAKDESAMDVTLKVLNGTMSIAESLKEIGPLVKNAMKSFKTDKSAIKRTPLEKAHSNQLHEYSVLKLTTDQQKIGLAFNLNSVVIQKLPSFLKLTDIGIWPNFELVLRNESDNNVVLTSAAVGTDTTDGLKINASVHFENVLLDQEVNMILHNIVLPLLSNASFQKDIKICTAIKGNVENSNLFKYALNSLKTCLVIEPGSEAVKVQVNGKDLPLDPVLEPKDVAASVDDDTLFEFEQITHFVDSAVEQKDEGSFIVSKFTASDRPPTSGYYMSISWPVLLLSLSLHLDSKDQSRDIPLTSVSMQNGNIKKLLAPDIDPMALFYDGGAQIDIRLHPEAKRDMPSVIKKSIENILTDDGEEKAKLYIHFGATKVTKVVIEVPTIKQLIGVLKKPKEIKFDASPPRKKPFADLTILHTQGRLFPAIRVYENKLPNSEWRIKHNIRLPNFKAGASLLSRDTELFSVALEIPRAIVNTEIGGKANICISGINLSDRWQTLDLSNVVHFPIGIEFSHHLNKDTYFETIQGVVKEIRLKSDLLGDYDSKQLTEFYRMISDLQNKFKADIQDIDSIKKNQFRLFLANYKEELDTLAAAIDLKTDGNSFELKFNLNSSRILPDVAPALMVKQDLLKWTVQKHQVPDNQCYITIENLKLPIRLGSYSSTSTSNVGLVLRAGCRFAEAFSSSDVRKYITSAIHGLLDHTLDISLSTERHDFVTEFNLTSSNIMAFVNRNFHLISNLRQVNPTTVAELESNIVDKGQPRKPEATNLGVELHLVSADIEVPVISAVDPPLASLKKILKVVVNFEEAVKTKLDALLTLSNLPFPQAFKCVDFSFRLINSITTGVSVGLVYDPIAQITLPEFAFSIAAEYNNSTSQSITRCNDCRVGIDLAVNLMTNGIRELLPSFRLPDISPILTSQYHFEQLYEPKTLAEKSHELFKREVQEFSSPVPMVTPVLVRIGNDSSKDALGTIVCGLTLDFFVSDWLNLDAKMKPDEIPANSKPDAPQPSVSIKKSTIDIVEFEVNIPLKEELPISLTLGKLTLVAELENRRVLTVDLDAVTKIDSSSKAILLRAFLQNQKGIAELVNHLLTGKPASVKLDIEQETENAPKANLCIPLRINLKQQLIHMALSFKAKKKTRPPVDSLMSYTGIVTAGPPVTKNIEGFFRFHDVSLTSKSIDVFLGLKQSVIPPGLKVDASLNGGKIKVLHGTKDISLEIKNRNNARLLREDWALPKKAVPTILGALGTLLPMSKDDKDTLNEISDDEGFSKNYPNEFYTIYPDNVKAFLSAIFSRGNTGGACFVIRDESSVQLKIGQNWVLDIDPSGTELPLIVDFFSNPCLPFDIVPKDSQPLNGENVRTGSNWILTSAEKGGSVTWKLASIDQQRYLTMEIGDKLSIKTNFGDYKVGEKFISRSKYMKPPGKAIYNIKYSSLEKKMTLFSHTPGALESPHYIQFPMDIEKLFKNHEFSVSTEEKVDVSIYYPPLDVKKTRLLYSSDYPQTEDNAKLVYLSLKDALGDPMISEDIYIKVTKNDREVEAKFSLDSRSGIYRVSLPPTSSDYLKIYLSVDGTNWTELPQQVYFPALK